MISERYRFIYVHVPKTGGNAVQSVLLPLSDDRKQITRHQDGTDRFEITGPITPRKHATLAEYHAALGGDLRGWRVLATLRHPFERALSGYFSSHRWFFEQPDGTWLRREPVWNEAGFARMLERGEYPAMVDYLRLGDTIHRPDFCLYHDCLIENLQAAATALDLPPLPPLPQLNRSVAVHERDALLASRALRDLAEAHYRSDMEFFSFPSYSPNRDRL
ncbi:sulfotransferase family 2 domain-containing protein [Alisedimentitalea sp. MJ-SS2]|uniref:sulfotransferase family 2 domain-containing protein n=1 Tax=Aliisedimentitalea sp. MJ-SS2 TaxID=3049795 RepID=UPI002906F8BC|nr:sulfotransferase family 2 domain-containing protein [Alisedimentitalea sp. MJ-SS2]MDU8930009.1 sulfotransferase family 2 domain-containing protein [Alisedimentitalea sp. MJ-SS2]